MKQELTVEPELLRAVITGEFSLEDAQRSFSELVDCAGRHKCMRVLVDGREIIGNPATIERFYYGAFAAHEVARLGKRVHFAYVLVPPVRDPDRFGETVAVNRGMSVKTFENVNEALQWLAERHT